MALPKPSGCPPMRTILHSSPEELVKRRSAGNLEHKDQELKQVRVQQKKPFTRAQGITLLYYLTLATHEVSSLSLSLRVHHQRDVAVDEGEGEELDTVQVLAGRRLSVLFGTEEEEEEEEEVHSAGQHSFI